MAGTLLPAARVGTEANRPAGYLRPAGHHRLESQKLRLLAPGRERRGGRECPARRLKSAARPVVLPLPGGHSVPRPASDSMIRRRVRNVPPGRGDQLAQICFKLVPTRQAAA